MYIPVNLHVVSFNSFLRTLGRGAMGDALVYIAFVALQSSCSHTAKNLELLCFSENSILSCTYDGFFFLAITWCARQWPQLEKRHQMVEILGRSDTKMSVPGCSNDLSTSSADLQSRVIFLKFDWKDQLVLYFFCSWNINKLLDHLGICHLSNSLMKSVWLHCVVRTEEERSPGLCWYPCKPPQLVAVASPLESHLSWE